MEGRSEGPSAGAGPTLTVVGASPPLEGLNSRSYDYFEVSHVVGKTEVPSYQLHLSNLSSLSTAGSNDVHLLNLVLEEPGKLRTSASADTGEDDSVGGGVDLNNSENNSDNNGKSATAAAETGEAGTAPDRECLNARTSVDVNAVQCNQSLKQHFFLVRVLF